MDGTGLSPAVTHVLSACVAVTFRHRKQTENEETVLQGLRGHGHENEPRGRTPCWDAVVCL